MGIESKVAVVTGGGRGIGRGIALTIAELGYTLVVNYRTDESSAESTCREAEKRRSTPSGPDPCRRGRPGGGPASAR